MTQRVPLYIPKTARGISFAFLYYNIVVRRYLEVVAVFFAPFVPIACISVLLGPTAAATWTFPLLALYAALSIGSFWLYDWWSRNRFLPEHRAFRAASQAVVTRSIPDAGFISVSTRRAPTVEYSGFSGGGSGHMHRFLMVHLAPIVADTLSVGKPDHTCAGHLHAVIAALRTHFNQAEVTEAFNSAVGATLALMHERRSEIETLWAHLQFQGGTTMDRSAVDAVLADAGLQ